MYINRPIIHENQKSRNILHNSKITRICNCVHVKIKVWYGILESCSNISSKNMAPNHPVHLTYHKITTNDYLNSYAESSIINVQEKTSQLSWKFTVLMCTSVCPFKSCTWGNIFINTSSDHIKFKTQSHYSIFSLTLKLQMAVLLQYSFLNIHFEKQIFFKRQTQTLWIKSIDENFL